jgi:hypothetical protein
MPRRDPLEAAAEKASRPKKEIPFTFVVDELADLDPVVKPLFSSHGVYVGDKLVFILRDKGSKDSDRGVWVVSEKDQTEAIHAVLPNLRRVDLLGDFIKNWHKLSANDDTFEDDVLTACALVLRRDPRIGKIPESKKPKAPRGPKAEKAPKPPRTGKATKTTAAPRRAASTKKRG